MTAVELDPAIAKIYQDYFPDDKVIVGDAHQYLLDHYKEFDFIWSSPPCPTHSTISINFAEAKGTRRIKPRYPDMMLWQEIIFLEHYFKGQYVVENVIPYYKPFIKCTQYGRHMFWSNFTINKTTGNDKPQNILRGSTEQAAKSKGIDDISTINGVSKRKVINNMVLPETGLYILNCARNIITKSNVQQIDIFE